MSYYLSRIHITNKEDYMEANKAILIESSPRLKCCVFSIEYGPICVSSCDDQSGMINVDSISLLHFNQLVSSFSMSSDQSNMKHRVYEEPAVISTICVDKNSDTGNVYEELLVNVALTLEIAFHILIVIKNAATVGI